jgi:outer membrane immunogenic protein
MYKCGGVASRLVLAFAISCAAGTASAADLGESRRGGYKDYGDPIVVPSPYFSWTGLYIGAHLGYGWGSSSVENDPSAGNGDGFDGPIDGIDAGPYGWLGGLTAGYNWQMDSFLIGVEADLGYLGAEDGDSNPSGFMSTEYGAYGTLTARIGYAEDRWLFYAKGGLAFADIETEAGALVGGAIQPLDYTHTRETQAGWALGFGVEHAFQPNLSLKAEYLYMDFGGNSSNNFDDDVFRHENDIHTIKVGLNYSLQDVIDPLK